MITDLLKRIKQDKKGQYVRAWVREQRSLERTNRIRETGRMLKEKYSLEEMAVQLGVSINTVKSYIPEAKELERREKSIEKEMERIEREQEEQKSRKREEKKRRYKNLKNESKLEYYLIKLKWWFLVSPFLLLFIFVFLPDPIGMFAFFLSIILGVGFWLVGLISQYYYENL